MFKENSITLKKITVLVLAITLCILIFIVWTHLVKPNMTNISMAYYKDVDTYEIVGVEINTEGFENESDSISYMLDNLYVSPANNKNLETCLPENISIIDYSYAENGTATINFSKEYYELLEIQKIYLKTAVVWSLTSISDIYTIIFLVEGEEMKKSNGEPLGFLNRTNVLIEPNLTLNSEL